MLDDIRSLLRAGADIDAPQDHGATLVSMGPREVQGGGCCRGARQGLRAERLACSCTSRPPTGLARQLPCCWSTGPA